MLSLVTPLGGLGLKIFAETTKNDFKNLTRITLNFQAQILEIDNKDGKTGGETKDEREKRNQEKLWQSLATSDEKTKTIAESLNQKGVSNWLTNLPIKEHGQKSTKQEFWDVIKIRYSKPLDRTPSQCISGESFDVTLALSCKKGSFITLRHIEIRYIWKITHSVLQKISRDDCR